MLHVYIKRVVYTGQCVTQSTRRNENIEFEKKYESVRIMCTCTRERVLKFVHYTVVSYNCYIQVLSFANRRICTRREKHNHPTPKPLSLFLFPPFLCFYNLLLSILRRISLYISPFNILVRAPLGPRLKASVLSIFNMSINYQRVPFSYTFKWEIMLYVWFDIISSY